MADNKSVSDRADNMSKIRAKNTKPEMIVRRYLHRAGFRYRIHASSLPGKPDIVLKKYMAVIFVNGCFWHRHEGCRFAYMPKTRPEFWAAKFEDNLRRDREALSMLRNTKFRVLIVWECGLRKKSVQQQTLEQIVKWIKSDSLFGELPLRDRFISG